MRPGLTRRRGFRARIAVLQAFPNLTAAIAPSAGITAEPADDEPASPTIGDSAALAVAGIIAPTRGRLADDHWFNLALTVGGWSDDRWRSTTRYRRCQWLLIDPVCPGVLHPGLGAELARRAARTRTDDGFNPRRLGITPTSRAVASGSM